MLSGLLLDVGPAQLAVLRQRFLRERRGEDASAFCAAHRTVNALLEAAEDHARERKQREARERAKEKARQEKLAAAARAKHLDGLAGKERSLWAEVETPLATKQARGYARAVEMLVDLRDLAARQKGSDFPLRLAALWQAHERKAAFLKRLRKAGL